MSAPVHALYGTPNEIELVPTGGVTFAARISPVFKNNLNSQLATLRADLQTASGTVKTGPRGPQGLTGPAGPAGPAGTFVGDIDGGNATTVYGGIDPIDGGTA